jgi:hypothetical protein
MPRRKIERSAEAFKAGTVFFFPSKEKALLYKSGGRPAGQ